MKNDPDTTISVRISKDLAMKFEETCRILPINRAEFLRAAIERLVKNNAPLVEHVPRFEGYINSLRKHLGTLPREVIEVKNGTWKTVADAAILELADEARAHVKEVGSIFDDLADNYGLEWEPGGDEDYVLDIGAIALLAMTRREVSPKDLFETTLPSGAWTDSIELGKVLLILALQKAIAEHGISRIIQTLIKVVSKEEGGKIRIVLDARGEFGRSGDSLITPVDFVKVDDNGG